VGGAVTDEPRAPDDVDPRGVAIAAGVVISMAMTLTAMGRVRWCACGSWVPWSFDVWSSHNSQHFVDPYAFTHLLHGLAFYALMRGLLGPRRLWWRFAAAITLESLWELVENSPFIIEKYRESTISLEYYGDSVANSVADVGACAVGFLVASKVPWKVAVALFVAAEIGLALWIRDGLLLNLLMLTFPIEAVKQWQLGAMG
jgi:hypothetical protein